MIPAIVLAAGKSSRMGRSKAALPLSNGDTFITRIVRTFKAASVEDVVVVVGHDAKVVVDAFAASDLVARFVENPDYEQGQLSSLLAGLRVVDRPGVVAALVTLVDVPLVGASTVRAVVDRYQAHARPYRASGPRQPARPSGADRSLTVRRDSPRGSLRRSEGRHSRERFGGRRRRGRRRRRVCRCGYAGRLRTVVKSAGLACISCRFGPSGVISGRQASPNSRLA